MYVVEIVRRYNQSLAGYLNASKIVDIGKARTYATRQDALKAARRLNRSANLNPMLEARSVWVEVYGAKRNPVRAQGSRVGAARNAARGNPAKDAKRAARLYREFHGSAPHEMLRVTHDTPHAAVDVGRVDAIEYTTTRDGHVEHYRHDFDPDKAPDLAAGANGYPLLFIGGKTTFTDRGIEDK